MQPNLCFVIFLDRKYMGNAQSNRQDFRTVHWRTQQLFKSSWSLAMSLSVLHLPRFPLSTMLPVTTLDGWVMSLNRQQSSTDTRTGNRRLDISVDISGTLTDHPQPRPSQAKSSALPSLLLTSIRHSKLKTDPPNCIFINTILFLWRSTAPQWAKSPDWLSFTITLSHTTLSRTPPDEWWARRRDVYLTTHNTYNRQASMHPIGFEPAIPANERPQIHASERAATGIGFLAQISADNPNFLLLFLSG